MFVVLLWVITRCVFLLLLVYHPYSSNSLTMMLPAIILLILVPFLWWYFTLRKYKSLEIIPGPQPLPIIGNILNIGNTPQSLLKNCFDFSKKYGGLYKLYVANELKVMISNADLLEMLLNSNTHITKSGAYDLFIPWLGIGLLISKGQKWKIRRKMITPTFHFKILEEFIDIFNSAGNTLVEKLSEEVGKDSTDVFPFINLYSLDVICETSMGIKIKAQENNNSEYVRAVREFLDITVVRIFCWEKFDALFKFTHKYQICKDLLKTLHQFTNSVILKRRLEKLEEKQETIHTSDDGIKRKTALLDMLLESENNDLLTNEDIREEIDTFMFEGHDTTTSGVAFTILALADHPDVQEKVYQEAISVIGSEENITMQHLQSVKYLDMVLKEVQRIYPSVPLIERSLETEYTMGGYNFPAGTTLSMFIYGLHHLEKYFPDPEKFDPERFLPENQAQRHKFAYVPFSAGPRNCIGQRFALLEMKASIIKIVKKFKILQVPNYKPELGMAGILKSYNGICVKLQLRD